MFTIHDKDNITFDFDFGEVKKGWSLEITLARKHANAIERSGVFRIHPARPVGACHGTVT
jgi:hypothetical protein